MIAHPSLFLAKKTRLATACFLLTTFCTQILFAATPYYKWTDKEGKTHYTSAAPKANESNTRTKGNDQKAKNSLSKIAEDEAKKREEAEKASQPPTQPKAVEAPKPVPAAATKTEAPSSLEEAKNQYLKKACEQANENIKIMTENGRVREKRNGEDYYLSAQEKEQKILETHKMIKTECKNPSKTKGPNK